jgi:hypothetical protein
VSVAADPSIGAINCVPRLLARYVFDLSQGGAVRYYCRADVLHRVRLGPYPAWGGQQALVRTPKTCLISNMIISLKCIGDDDTLHFSSQP